MKNKVFILVAISVLPLHSQDKPDLEFNDVENRFAPKSMDKTLKAFGKSTSIRWVARQIRKQLSTADDESEKDTYLKFFKIAQNDMKIPKEDQLPVQYSNFQEEPWINTLAVAHVRSILVNRLLSDHKNSFAIGPARRAAYHEVMHSVYNDKLIACLFPCAYCVGLVSSLIAFRLLIVDKEMTIKDLVIRTTGLALSIGLNRASRILAIKFARYQEQRADIESYKRLKCYKCVEEMRTHSPSNIDFENSFGYVATDRLQIFYDRYKQASCLCPFHKKREHEDRSIFISEISEEELKEYAQQARSA
ncbi:hypothetical protein A3F66_01035 [candidate division TM6 bacterium RIFCSPHIGHO2_12_FULL_32_22]|nr:MAG: hypothetical protein A3F66_01035 [candidate division TM6 bacterium RIFCSPHIGHO2_12_FULL_32_22]